MQKSAGRMAEKRRRARESGLCISCCRERPAEGRTVCRVCTQAAYRRTIRRRAALRRHTEFQRIIAAHERAGDAAREHHLYEDAAHHYQSALTIEGVAQADHSRISEKLAYALSLGGNPSEADPLLDRVLASYIGKPGEGAKTVEILLHRASQFMIDARHEASLSLLKQAVQIAERDGDARLRKLANSQVIQCLLELSRYREAESFLDAFGEVDIHDSDAIRTTFYIQKGIIAAIFGDAAEAFEYFEWAVNTAKENTDIFHATDVWVGYGYCALSLGRIELAQSCYERALLLARRNHIVWLIPYICLVYAHILFLTGQYGIAHEYLLNALSYDAHASKLDVAFVEVGIPIALYIKDEVTLAKCARTSAVAFAFRSGHPSLIGPLAAAFAQWHVANGRQREARALLHRALDVLHDVEQMPQIWTFPIAVAQFGSRVDIPRARHFLETRVALPSADLASACLDLFDAFVAQRRGQSVKMQQHAIDAVRRFETLGWHGYTDLARTLLPVATKSSTIARSEGKPFADISPALTSREQQVAELVLKGFTNRAIAAELAISKHTVDSHVASIINRLGIRSRYQLAEALPKSQESYP